MALLIYLLLKQTGKNNFDLTLAYLIKLPLEGLKQRILSADVWSLQTNFSEMPFCL